MNSLHPAERCDHENGKCGSFVTPITISEANRATSWERWPAGIEILQKWVDHYRRTGVNAILAGVKTKGNPPYKYAVFVEDGFLREIDRDV